MVGKRLSGFAARTVAIIAVYAALAAPVRAHVPQGRVASTDQPMSLSRRVSIDVERAELLAVLHTIARQAGLIPAYNSATVPLAARVTLHLKDVIVTEAFERALHGTGLAAQVWASGKVTITRTATAAAEVGSITGTVTDANTKRPIRGVKITVDGIARAETDSKGVYQVSNVSAGSHAVIIKAIGYARVSRTVTVRENAATTIDVALETAATPLDQVVVTGTILPTELRAVSSAITVITAKQLEERNITQLNQLFRGDVPGLFAIESGTFAAGNGGNFAQIEMFSRGATKFGSGFGGAIASNAIKTYVDGVEMNDSRYLGQIDPKSIERIEIITGPQASTIYGSNAINGVMQVFTKRGKSIKPKLQLSYRNGLTENNYSTGLAPTHNTNLSVDGVQGRISYNVGGTWSYIGSWTPSTLINTFGGYGGIHTQFGPLKTDVSIRNVLSRNKNRGSEMRYDDYMREQGIFGGIPEPQPAPVQLMGVTTRTLGVTFGHALTNWWSHELNLGMDVSNSETTTNQVGYSYPGDTAGFFLRRDNGTSMSQRYVTTMQIPISSFARMSLAAGTDHWTRRTDVVGLNSSTNGIGTFFNAFMMRTRPTKDGGAFLQVGPLVFHDRLSIDYGVRVEWNPYQGEDAKVRPGKFGAAYTQDIGSVTTKVRGSYGRSTRPPGYGLREGLLHTYAPHIQTYGPIYARLPNPELGPEFQQGGEGGIELYFGGRGSLVITRYNQTVADLIQGIAGADSARALRPGLDAYSCEFVEQLASDGYCYEQQSQTLNVGSIRNQGWELQGSWNLGPLTAGGTYSWTKSRMIGITPRFRAKFPNVEYVPGFSFDYLAEHTWALNARYSRASTSIGMYVTGMGENYLQTSELARLSSIRYRNIGIQPRVTGINSRNIGAGYATININAMHAFSKKLSATLDMSNVTDHYRNDISVLYPTAGRRTEFGFTFRP